MSDLQIANCKLCGHSTEDNAHGFDQSDADVDEDGNLIHSGSCIYCKECRAILATPDPAP